MVSFCPCRRSQQRVGGQAAAWLVVRRGDPGAHRDLGRGGRPEGAEGIRPQRLRLRRDLRANARPGLLQDLGAVPLESQVPEEQLPAVLRQEEVRRQAGQPVSGGAFKARC